MTHLTTLAMNSYNADREYERAFGDYYNSLKPLDDDRYYEMAPALIGLLRERLSVERASSTLAVKNAIDEFMRLAVVGEANYSLEDCVRFTAKHEEIKAALYKPLFDVIEGRGDDGYGDLLDGLALALPRNLAEDTLAGKFGAERFFKEAFHEAIHTDLHGLFWHGENYFGMRLRDEALARTKNEAVKSVLDSETVVSSETEPTLNSPDTVFATVDSPVEITEDRIRCLLCSAFEGGMSSWIGSVEYKLPEGITKADFKDPHSSKPDTPAGRFTFEGDYWPTYLLVPFVSGCSMKINVEDDVEENIDGKLNRETMLRGLNLMAAEHPRHFRDFVDENDDAITGDVYLQCCVLGEVVYG